MYFQESLSLLVKESRPLDIICIIDDTTVCKHVYLHLYSDTSNSADLFDKLSLLSIVQCTVNDNYR